MAFNPDGKSLVTADDKASIRIWDSQTWKESRSLQSLGAERSFLFDVVDEAEIHWLKPGKPGAARLKIRVVNYPEEYFKSNSPLSKKEQSYELEIAVEKLVAKPVR